MFKNESLTLNSIQQNVILSQIAKCYLLICSSRFMTKVLLNLECILFLLLNYNSQKYLHLFNIKIQNIYDLTRKKKFNSLLDLADATANI